MCREYVAVPFKLQCMRKVSVGNAKAVESAFTNSALFGRPRIVPLDSSRYSC